MMHAELGFQAVRVALPDDVTLFPLTVRHDAPVPNDGRAEQEALLRSQTRWHRLGDVGDPGSDAAGENVLFRLGSQIRMPSWTHGRVALVGDAAASPSFLAGQGSALAMVEAYSWPRNCPAAGEHGEAFARYEQRLAPFLRSNRTRRRGWVSAFAPTSRLQLLVRNTVMRLMGPPKVADLAMGKSFCDAVELPKFATS